MHMHFECLCATESVKVPFPRILLNVLMLNHELLNIAPFHRADRRTKGIPGAGKEVRSGGNHTSGAPP